MAMLADGYISGNEQVELYDEAPAVREEPDPIQQEIDNTALAVRPEESEPVATVHVPDPAAVTATSPPKQQEIGTSVDGLAFSVEPPEEVHESAAPRQRESEEASSEIPKDEATQTLEQPEDEPEAEKECPEPGTFFFVYNEHSDKSAIAGMKKMVEADVGIIAVEAPDIESEARRQELSDLLTKAVASDADDEDIFRAGHAVGQELSYLDGVVRGLFNSDKRIELIDVNLDDPRYPEIKRNIEDGENWATGMGERRTMDEVRVAAQALVATMAAANVVRDDIMADQLDELSRNNPGVRIGVFVGPGHEPVKSRLEARGHSQIDTVFLNSKGSVQELRQPTATKLIHEVEIDDARELRPEELNRLILEQTIVPHMRARGEESSIVYSATAVDTQSDVQVEELLDVVEVIKMTGTSFLEVVRHVGTLATMIDEEYLYRHGFDKAMRSDLMEMRTSARWGVRWPD